MGYTAPAIPNVSQESTLQQILLALGGGSTGTWVNRGATTVNSLVVSAVPKTLVQFIAVNENAAGTANRWVMLFDAAALPANGATPILAPWLLPAQGLLSIWDIDYVATTGLVLGISTTNTTLTVSVDAPGTSSLTAKIE